tara:strand:+ start:421 stop:759 length:339 start_codon:yes stop_codon:yes gene_type:complete
LSILEEIESIAEKEFSSWTHKELMNGMIRLITIELFLRMNENSSGDIEHVWLTSSNHPLLLNVFSKTEYLPMSGDLLDGLTEQFSKLLDISVDDMYSIIQTLVTVEELEEEQ